MIEVKYQANEIVDPAQSVEIESSRDTSAGNLIKASFDARGVRKSMTRAGTLGRVWVEIDGNPVGDISDLIYTVQAFGRTEAAREADKIISAHCGAGQNA